MVKDLAASNGGADARHLSVSSTRPKCSSSRVEPSASTETLHGFAKLVDQLGGDGIALLLKCGVDPAVMEDPTGVLPYRTLVNLLESAARELRCPDFGMQLAAVQGPRKIIGPLGVAMRNSPTLGAALRYCSKNGRVFSKAASVILEKLSAQRHILRFDVLLEDAPGHIQVIEHHMWLVHHAIAAMSRDNAQAHEIWFMHEPCAKLSSYRSHYGARIRFGESINGLVFNESDLGVPLANPDRQLYALATSFISHSFPAEQTRLSERLRLLLTRLLRDGDCTQKRAAAELRMHPRTLQRRLREEGDTFESIKDSVRRDAALHYLSQRQLPFVQVAAALGYWEVSTLSRSCYRWFSASPRRLRKALANGETVLANPAKRH